MPPIVANRATNATSSDGLGRRPRSRPSLTFLCLISFLLGLSCQSQGRAHPVFIPRAADQRQLGSWIFVVTTNPGPPRIALVIGPIRTSFVTGLESWFTLPGQPGRPPPPPYKMALLTWVTIFPLITAIVI